VVGGQGGVEVGFYHYTCWHPSMEATLLQLPHNLGIND
jgi:hypothetical protein